MTTFLARGTEKSGTYPIVHKEAIRQRILVHECDSLLGNKLESIWIKLTDDPMLDTLEG